MHRSPHHRWTTYIIRDLADPGPSKNPFDLNDTSELNPPPPKQKEQ